MESLVPLDGIVNIQSFFLWSSNLRLRLSVLRPTNLRLMLSLLCFYFSGYQIIFEFTYRFWIRELILMHLFFFIELIQVFCRKHRNASLIFKWKALWRALWNLFWSLFLEDFHYSAIILGSHILGVIPDVITFAHS